MKNLASESYPMVGRRLSARISGYGLILATFMSLASSTAIFAQDVYNVRLDGGALIIEDLNSGGGAAADFLSIDSDGTDIIITDLSNTFTNAPADAAITLVDANTVKIAIVNIAGSIHVDMADGVDKIVIGSTNAVPFDLAVASDSDLEIQGIDVDGDLAATATDIDVLAAGGGIDVTGDLTLLTTASTVSIQEPVEADGDLTIQASVLSQRADIEAGGTLTILQNSDGISGLSFDRDASDLLTGVEIIIGDRTLGGTISLIGSPISSDKPLTVQTLGTLNQDFALETTSAAATGILTLRGNIINQGDDISAEGILIVNQPGDGSTSLTLNLNGSVFESDEEIDIGDETDAGNVTVVGSILSTDKEIHIRSGGSVDISGVAVAVTGNKLFVVGGGANGGSSNFIGDVTALTGLDVKGGNGGDTFTFGGGSQSLDGLIGTPVSVNGLAGIDNLVLDDVGDASGNDYTVENGSVERVGGPTIDHENVERLEVKAGDGNDILIVDFDAGDPFTLLTNGLDFDGGGQGIPKSGMSAGGDALELTGGGTFGDVDYVFDGVGSGSIAVDGGDIFFAGLEPIMDHLVVVNRSFTGTASSETITLGDDSTPNDDYSELTTTIGEDVVFKNPTGSLTVGAEDGDDIIIVHELDALFVDTVPITINGEDGADDITIDVATSFEAPIFANGNDGNDFFTVKPRVGTTGIDGGDPTAYPGDVLDLDLSGLPTIASFTPASPLVDRSTGTWSFVGLDDVDFTSIEEQLDLSDVDVDISVNNDEPTVGSTIIYTVSAENLLPGHSTGLKVIVPLSLMGHRVLSSEADQGEYDPANGIWTIGEVEGPTTVELVIHAQIRVFRHLDVYAEAYAVDQFDPNSTPNNGKNLENDYAEVGLDPQPVETPGPNDFFRPTSVEGTSFATFAVSPNDPTSKGGPSTNFLFAGSTDGGLHRSSDGGANWPRVGLQDKIIRAMSISSLTGAIYVGDYGEGVYRSADDGLTFTDMNTGLTSSSSKRVIASVIDEFAPATGADGDVYIGTDGGGVFRSTNNGSSWTATTGLGHSVVRALLVVENGSTGGANEQIYAGTLGGGVYTLEEGTTTWTAANGSGVGHKLGDKLVYALAHNAGAIYAGTGSGIYKTTDKGVTWTQVLADTPTRALAIHVVGSTEYIFAGTTGAFVQVSTDGGATWFELNVGFADSTIEVLFATDDDVLFAGTATQGIFRSDDLGATWYRVTSFMQNAVIQAMAFDEGGELYVGTYGYGVFHTDDAVNFTQVNTGLDNHWVFALARTPGDALFAGTWNKGVYRSMDDAHTWQFIGLPHRNVYDFAVYDEFTIYAATDRGEVARTVDNGLTWHQVGVAQTAIYSLIIDPNNPSIIYAGTFGAGTYKSTDGGQSFAKTGMPDAHVFDFAFDPLDLDPDGRLVAATSMGPMYTTDGGANWTTFTTGLDNVDTRAVAYNDLATLLIGTWGGGVARWTGSTWIDYGLTEMPILAFAINPVDGDLYAGTDGMGVFRRSFGVITGREQDEPQTLELPMEYALDQNYPNPFNPTTTIAFDLPASGYTRLVVYDMVGREVQVLIDGTINAGRHEAVLDATGLPSGVYMYRLETEGHSFARKMVLMK